MYGAAGEVFSVSPQMGSFYVAGGTQVPLWWDTQKSCQKRWEEVKDVSSVPLNYLGSCVSWEK